eukprot:5629622-Pleurochrysis_carterae.AAC.2
MEVHTSACDAAGPKMVSVDDKTYTAKNILIAVGGTPATYARMISQTGSMHLGVLGFGLACMTMQAETACKAD